MMTHNESVREQILESANHIMNNEGVQALRISRIVSECKISKSTFYQHFSSKEELFDTIRDRGEIDLAEIRSMQNRIVAAAVEEFSKHTFRDIDMEDIARAAGITRSSLYRYFSNKEELLVASIHNEQDRRVQTLENLRKESDDPPLFFELFMNYFDRYANDPNTSHLYATMIYYSKHNAQVKDGFDRLREYTVRLLQDNLEEGKRRGMYKQDADSGVYAQMFFSVMSGINIHSPSTFSSVSRHFLEMMNREIGIKCVKGD
ncbi:AcrR family transcriptional regulator [Paenibacillus anaericanus]|uniref:TetR/AcrR family transcriptional regulator n=1 Tax=Paenibacillus anaericanus TaxID=170367 RepID=UPI00278AD083|nr:TetR/AcrR family transcriptional regulator [Paenibacillus anaericanus]MDQ0087644.1 AcrR family transcriptional regulator [Paenibacillus anaericanus]